MSDGSRSLANANESASVERMRCMVYEDGNRPRLLSALDAISDSLRAPDTFVWFDIVAPKAEEFALIKEEFGLHPLAIEDALKANQRPKIEAYGDSWFLVLAAATRNADELRIVELAIFAGAQFIVTVRSAPPYPLDEVDRRWEHLPTAIRRDSGALLYTILDTVVDGYTLIGEAIEERVEALEFALLGDARRTNTILLEIYQMQKDLGRFRRAVVPVREILTPILRGDLALFGADEIPYYRDVYDHTTRVIDQLDSARELINNARDIHISMASHRQNEVAKQLTIVATVFLPLTFITGFFGQNFGWLVNHITGGQTFIIWGLGSEVFAFIGLLAYFRYKHWS